MRTTIMKFLAKVTAVVTILASVATVSPALAATATSVKDTMSTLTASATSVTHAVSMTLPTGPFSGTLVLTYNAGFSAFSFTSGSCVGGTVTNSGTATNVVSVTLSTCGAGALTVNFTGTNPAATGSMSVAVSGTAGFTGAPYAVAIVTSDQVSVSASVDPSITFRVVASTTTCTHGTDGSGTDAAPAGNGGTVTLGSLTSTAVNSSDAASVPHICTFVSTNGGSGYGLSVKSTNGGLKSASALNTIPATPQTGASTSDSIAAGAEHYGLCLSTATVPNMDATTPTGVNLTGTSPFNSVSCTGVTTTENAGKLTTSTNAIGANTGAVQESTAQWLVKAAISATTPAHNDYSDTLTFVATGTF